MKKGTVITRVSIRGNRVTAYGRIKNGDEIEIPLSSVQRNIFLRWGKHGRYDDVRKEFGTPNIINEDTFKIEYI